MKKILLFSSVIFAVSLSNNVNHVYSNEYAGDYNVMRIENEDKLVVPREKTKEVWNYMVKKLVNDKSYLKSLDSGFESYCYDELFIDIYFDSPALQMLKKKSGIRYRTRWNLDNPDHKKSGRRLLQVKINDIDGNELNRGELKFKIDPSDNPNTRDELHPVIGLIDKPLRGDFNQRMTEIGVDPYSLKEILKLKQLRHSLYITLNGKAFMSIRLDEVSSKKFWFIKWEHVELEPELNEVPYTEAAPEERERMEEISKKIVADILKEFPEIKRDLTPKYNKAFEYFESKIPFFHFLVKNFSI